MHTTDQTTQPTTQQQQQQRAQEVIPPPTAAEVMEMTRLADAMRVLADAPQQEPQQSTAADVAPWSELGTPWQIMAKAVAGAVAVWLVVSAYMLIGQAVGMA